MEILYFVVPVVVGGLVGLWYYARKAKKNKENK